LNNLTSIKNAWKWSAEEQESFNKLKEVLTNPPVLTYYSPHRPVTVDTDASAFAIGAVLSQIQEDGTEKVVAYYSRCLSNAERNYCVTRRELLAIVEALRHWRHYVTGKEITVRSDHSSLSWLKKFKEPEGQMARWLEKLSEFKMTIEYRRGSEATNADGLSRRPCAPDCPHCRRREERENSVIAGAVMAEEADWKMEQGRDRELNLVREWVIGGQKPEWEDVSGETPTLKSLWGQFEVLTYQNEVLCRKFLLPFGHEKLQVIVPEHLRTEVTRECHNSGHFGQQRTRDTLSARFFWPFWKKDVSTYVAGCLVCNQRKGPRQRHKLPIKRYQASEAMQRLAIDMLGPLPITSAGNKYLVIITDYFSKWVEALPVPNMEATTVANVLVNCVISRYGVPGELHSDQGKNFDSQLIKNLCARLGIVKTRTAPYRPQSDGQTERFNRTILDALSKLCHSHNDWDVFTPLVCLYYRASVHSSTGVTPALLMLGKEIRLPVDIAFPPVQEKCDDTYEGHAEKLEKSLNMASEFARKHLRLSWDTMKSHSQVTRKAQEIDVSRPVLLFSPVVPKGYTPKLASLWKGPYEVMEKLSPYLFRIKVGGRRGSQVVHRSNMYQPQLNIK
jgi:hypothetical protein